MLKSFERILDIDEREYLQCGHCERETIHSLESRCTGSWEVGDGAITGGQEHNIYRCGACDTVCFESNFWDSETVTELTDGSTHLDVRTYQYPTSVSGYLNFKTEAVPDRLQEILDETLYAMAGAKLVLATIGLRLAIEYITRDKGTSDRGLPQRINDLHEQTLIDDDQRDLLHRIRIRGNSGAHEAVGMTPRELGAGLSILEGLLEKIYNGPARHTESIERAKEIITIERNPDWRTASRGEDTSLYRMPKPHR
jgi:hypothetical protein